MRSSDNHQLLIQLMPQSPNYQCPICQSAMSQIENSVKCDHNHQFDFAKEGYVNLLPVQFKKSLNPGDDKEMVLARRRFLELGHYEFLRLHLLNVITKVSPKTIVDLGCGEGYYTSFIALESGAKEVYGVDISKDAIKYSAKRSKLVHYSVATNSRTPFADEQFDVILNVFAPLVGKECKRILNEQGLIISAAPGEQHLLELKQAIYDQVELHDAAKVPDGFKLQSSENISQTVTLKSNDEVIDLLNMTPFGWKIVPEKKQTLLENKTFSVTLSFDINIFEPIEE